MDDDLGALWASVKQAPDHASRRVLLCGPLAAIVRALDVTSLEYKSVFGEENELLSVVCRTVVHDCRTATSRGYPLDLFGAYQLLNSMEHISLLALLGNLVSAGESSGPNKGYIEASARVLSLHNVPQHLCLLHEAYVEVLEHGRAATADETKGMSSWAVTPGATDFAGSDIVPNLERVVVSPEVVATAQRQLSTLATILRSAADAGATGALQLLLDDLVSQDRLLCLLRTFPSHLHYPHSGASSVASLTHDVVTFVLSVAPARLPGPIIARAVDALIGAFRFNFRDDASEAAVVEVSDALQAQRLMVFESLLRTLHGFLTVVPAPSGSKISDSFDEMTDFTGAVNPSALEYNAIVNGMLMIESALQAHTRLADRLFEALMRLASVAPLMLPQTKSAQPEVKPRSYSIARFLSKALTAHPDKAAAKTAPTSGFNGTTIHVAEVVEAASSFVVCCSFDGPRQNVGNRVLSIVGDTEGVKMDPATRMNILMKFVENLRNFEAPLQVAIVSAFSGLVRGGECNVQDHMPSLISALHARSISYECASAILSLLTGIAGNHGFKPSNLRVMLLEHGSVPVVLSLLDFLATNGPEAARFILTSKPSKDDDAASPRPRVSGVARWNETLLALLADFWRELISITPSGDAGEFHPVFVEPTTIGQLLRCVTRRNTAGATARDMLVAICHVSPSAVGAGIAAAIAEAVPHDEDAVEGLDLAEAAVSADAFWDVGLAAYEVFLASAQSERHFVEEGGLTNLMRVLTVFARFHPDLLRSWHPRTVLLTVLLSMTLRHVRFARDAEAHLLEATVHAPPGHPGTLQLLLDVATGALIAPANAASTRQWIAAAARSGVAADASAPDSPVEARELRQECCMQGPFYVPEDTSRPPQWAPLELAMDALCDRVFGTDEHPITLDEDVAPHATAAILHAAAGLRSVGSPSFRQAILRRVLPASAIVYAAAVPHAMFRNLLSETANCGASLSIISSLLQGERVPRDVAFVERGLAACDVSATAPCPQPGRGLSMAGWVRWETHIASSPRRTRREGSEVPIWGVRVGTPTAYATIVLAVDIVADEAIIRTRNFKGAEATVTLPTIDAGEWQQVGFSIDFPTGEKGSAPSQLTFYRNGAVVQRVPADALAAVLLQADPCPTLRVRLGFPPESAVSVGRSVSFGPTATFTTAVGHGTVARMFAADRSQPLSVSFRPPGPSSQLLSKAHLSAREQRLVLCTMGDFTLDNIQESDPVEEQDIAAVFHPADPIHVQIDCPLAGEWGNTGVGVPNLAGSAGSTFLLTTPHFTPRPSSSVGHQLAGSAGHSVLLGWLDGAVSKDEPEITAAVLRCLGSICECCDFDRLTGPAAWFAAVKLLFGAGSTISEAVVLRELLSIAFPRHGGVGARPADTWPIVASITLADHAVLRWELLSYLPGSAALLTLDAVATLVSVENPLRQFNAQRLFLANIVTHFSFGMSRTCVDAASLLRAGEVLEDFLVALARPGAAAAELLAFTASSVPVQGKADECALRLVTAVPIEPSVTSVRNTILRACVRATRRRGDTLAKAFATSCPTWWLATLCDPHAGPITVALALELFGLMLADPNFSKRARKSATVGLLMKQCLPHAHQTDVLNGLTFASLGVPCFPKAPGQEPASNVTPSCDVAYLPALLRCIRALTATLAAPEADTMPTRPITVRSYFEDLSAVSRYKPSRLRSAAMAVFAVQCFKSVRRSAVATLSAAMLNRINDRVCPLVQDVEEQDRRLALVKHILHFVASLTPNNTVLECFTAASHPSAMSEVSWLLFCLVPPVPPPAESAMLRQATQEECALVIVDTSSEDDVASPNPRSDMTLSDPARQSTSIWSVEDVEHPPGRHAGALIGDAAEFIEGLCIAVACSSASPMPLPGSSSVKAPPVVCLLHQLLNACPQDAPLFSRQWYQAKLLTTFFGAMRKGVATAVAGPAQSTQLNLMRNSAAIGSYAVERLSAGLPASAGDVIAYINGVHFELGKHGSTAEVNPLRQRLLNASVDWALFALSPAQHGWSRRLMIKSCESIVHFASLIFANPLTTEGLKSLLPRLAEVSLGIVIDYEASTSPAGRAVGEIWYKVFHVCRDSPVLTNGLIDSNSNPRTDLLHGGFDILYRQYDPIATFTGWFADCRYQVAGFFRKCYGNSATKYVECVPQRHARGAAKAEQLWQLGSMQAEMRASETLSTCAGALDRALESATLVEQSLISLRTSTAAVLGSFVREPAVLEPLAAPSENSQPGDERQTGYTTYDPPSGHLYLSATSDCGGPTGTLVAALVPVFGSGLTMGIVDPSTGMVPTPDGERDLIQSAGTKVWLNPASQLLLTRLLGGRCAPIHWIGNVYVIAGGDSHIAVVVLTQTELCFITMAQYIAASRDLVIAQPQAHDAASKKQNTRSVVTNMLRRFLPSSASVANRVLSAETEGGFRFSQYYRQIKAEETRNGRCDSTPRVWRVGLAWVTAAANRSFQHQRAALELTLESQEAWLFVVLDDEMTMRKVVRDRFAEALTGVAPWVTVETTASMRNRVTGAQRMWLRRQMSTLSYLSLVNSAGSRTPCDLSQYPVLPWTLPCSDEDPNDAVDPKAMRDLSKPIGATNSQRAEEIAMRYAEWLDDETPPFHHGTHYSSSAVVMYFLVRLNPFSSQSARYQGGRLDVADRLFHSLTEAWGSSTGARGGDTKELIPEIFTLPELTFNSNAVALGTRRDGVALGSVQLPKWATSPHKFCVMQRAALESEAAGAGLSGWIDLVFGSKQQGDEAVAAVNVFHHVSYERGLQRAMEAATSEESRKAIVAQVENFGLTPRATFKSPHPKRQPLATPSGATSKQAQFIHALPSLTEKPERNATRHPRSSGGAIALREVDSVVLGCTDRHWYSGARPLQCVELRGRYDVTVRSRDDDLVSYVPSIAGYGEGDAMCLAVSASGNVLCVATCRAVVFVYVRNGPQSRFTLAHILRHSARGSSRRRRVSLRMIGNSTLVAIIDERFVASWRVTVQSSAFCFVADVNALEAEDETVRVDEAGMGSVVSVCLDARDSGRSGFMYVCCEWGIVMLSRRGRVLASNNLRSASVAVSASPARRTGAPPADQPPAGSTVSSLSDSVTSTGLQHLNGTQRLRVMSALQEPLTCVRHIPWPTYSAQEVLVAGHADGSLSFWIVQSITGTVEAAAYRVVFHTMQPRADGMRPSPATAILPRQERGFAVSFEDGSVSSFAVSLIDSDPL